MERIIDIEEVRDFLAAADKQFTQGGIAINNVVFKRNKDKSINKIIIKYEQKGQLPLCSL